MVEAGGASEEQLLAGARRGDRTAFELLVERHRGELHASLPRLTSAWSKVQGRLTPDKGPIQRAGCEAVKGSLSTWELLRRFVGKRTP